MSTKVQHWDQRIKIISAMIFISLGLYVVTRMPSCGTQPHGETPPNLAAPAPKKECGALQVGQTKSTACPDGKGSKVEACTEAGLVTAIDCEKPKGVECGKTTFAEVRPILAGKCLACHAGYDEFVSAAPRGSDMVKRVNLAPGAPQRMPKAPSQPLSDAEKDLFKKWELDGFLEKCASTPDKPKAAYINFDQIESALVERLNGLNEEDRLNSRFLVLSHKINENVPAADLEIFTQSTNKVVNSIAARARRLNKLEVFGPGNSIVRIDLNAFELKKADWDKIISYDPLKIESFTNKGKVIKFLTQNARPWVHFDNFIEVTQRNAELYYDLLGIPSTFDQLAKNLGVNFAGDIINFRAAFVGTSKSPISLHKNRLMTRHDSVDNYFWVTFDPAGPDDSADKNLFAFPLVKEIGSKKVFNFAAGEVIYTMPNKMQAYALFNNKGQRQNAAPLNVVADNVSPVTPEIQNALSCHRCHAAGLNIEADEIRDHVLKNASEFNQPSVKIGGRVFTDLDLVVALYKKADFNTAMFKKDNDAYVATLGQIGVNPGLDPITYASDRFLLNWNLQQVASFLFFKSDEFAQLLNQSSVARAQVGNLLSGSSITHDQFVTILPQLIRDLRLFQEPVGG